MKKNETKFERTRSKSSASSRIRSLSNDGKSLLCFHRGNEDLNSGSDITPGHVSSVGVPSVLGKLLIELIVLNKIYFTEIYERVDQFQNHLETMVVLYTFRQIYNQQTKHPLIEIYVFHVDRSHLFFNTYLDMNNVKHRVKLQALYTIK
jgi:hypothetical protein